MITEMECCGTGLKLVLRWILRRDMDDVIDIENDVFEFPWTEDQFINCLHQRNCIGIVAELDDQVVGFMVYELHRTRIHVLNFVVAKDHQRQGVGGRMIAKLIAQLSIQRRSRIVLEVRESNLPAQLFFRESGFRAVSVMRNYYIDTPEDSYVMEYRHGQ